MKKTINSILFYSFIIFIVTAFTFAVIDKAQGEEKVKTKEENYIESKHNCSLIKEKQKDKTINYERRLFEMDCNGIIKQIYIKKDKVN